jgi:hypothetical protein
VGPGDMCLGLDQIPESLLPAVACGLYLPLGSFDVAAIVLLFSLASSSCLVYPSGLACVTDLIDWRPSRVGAV